MSPLSVWTRVWLTACHVASQGCAGAIEQHVATVHYGLRAVEAPALGAGGGGLFKPAATGSLPTHGAGAQITRDYSRSLLMLQGITLLPF